MFFHRRSMKWTLFFTYAALTLAIACILAQSSYRRYSEILLQKTIAEKRNNVSIAADQINAVMQNAKSLSQLAVLNDNLQALAGKSLAPFEEYDRGFMLKDDFNYILQNFGNVDGVIADFDDGRVYCTSNVDSAAYSGIGDSLARFPYMAMGYQNKVSVVNTRKARYFLHTQPTDVISICRPIISYTTTDIVGVLQFDIQEARISEILEASTVSASARIYLADEDGLILSASDKARIQTQVDDDQRCIDVGSPGVLPANWQRWNSIRLSQSLPEYGWRIVAFFPMDEIIYENREALRSIWIISGLCALFALLPIFLLSNGISRPLKQLSETMALVGDGDLTIRADTNRRDEIGQLSSVFNGMMARIQDLMRQNEQEQQEKRKFEFMAMQQQIQPHFLYNTLDNICALISLKYDREAFQLTERLAHFYRASLSGERMLIPLERELDIVDNYLAIQKFRFHDSFRYSITSSPECATVLVPKLIVQPLAENALVHGVRGCGYLGTIDIRCHLEGEYLNIEVADNGQGFDKEALKVIHGGAAAEEQPNRGFGVQSIVNRLKFYYDPACRMHVKNLEPRGSVVSIVLRKEVGPGDASDYRR